MNGLIYLFMKKLVGQYRATSVIKIYTLKITFIIKFGIRLRVNYSFLYYGWYFHQTLSDKVRKRNFEWVPMICTRIEKVSQNMIGNIIFIFLRIFELTTLLNRGSYENRSDHFHGSKVHQTIVWRDVFEIFSYST